MAHYSWSPPSSSTDQIDNNMIETYNSPVSSTDHDDPHPYSQQVYTLSKESMPVNAFPKLKEVPVQRIKGPTELVAVRKVNYNSNNNASNTFNDEFVIPKETAVCRFCFYKILENEQNVWRASCMCSSTTLTHYECAIDQRKKKGDWNCRRCGQEIKFDRVAILTRPTAAANSSVARPAVNQEPKYFRPHFLQRRRGWWWF